MWFWFWISYFAELGQVKKIHSYFADFGQVKKALWMASPWMAASNLWSLQNSLRRNRMLRQPLLFVYWLPKHPVFWFTLTQSTYRLPMVTYPSLCKTCVTYRTLCHAIGHQVLPTQPLLREAEDFPTGDNHSKHMPLLTYLV